MPKLRAVTITGADDSTSHSELAALSRKYPFVEWGILASASSVGTPRFPTYEWMHELQAWAKSYRELNLSLHLCGRWVRQLLLGNTEFEPELLDNFSRVQLNFHAEKTQCLPALCIAELKKFGDRQIIFQLDGAKGNEHLESIRYQELNLPGKSLDCVGLFDVSGGTGVLPSIWPKVMQGYWGYAGGLGPENLEYQLPRILESAGNASVWIDMETRVRSADNQEFTLSKVARCLEIAAPFVSTL